MKTGKIVLEKVDNSDDYEVVKLVNRTEPILGSIVTKKDIEQLLEADYDLTTEINKPK